MHRRYGPIVRINPREVHISDPDWNGVYKYSSKASKPHWFYMRFFGMFPSTNTAESHALHQLRRAPLQNYFASTNIQSYMPIILAQVEKLCNRLKEKDGRVVSLSDAFRCLATDVATGFAFGTPFGHLDEPTFDHEFNLSVKTVVKLSMLSRHAFGLFLPVLHRLPEAVAKRMNPAFGRVQWMREMMTSCVKRSMNKPEPAPGTNPDMIQTLVSSSLPPEEKTFPRLFSETRSIIMAGTETTASTLITITASLLSDPGKLLLLKHELGSAEEAKDGPLEYSELKELPYITGVVNEGLRLANPTPSRLPRICKDQDLRYKEWTIPKGTTISTTSQDIHLNPEIFPDPSAFQPERWANPGDRKFANRYLMPWGRGTRLCLGAELAKIDIYLTVSRLFSPNSGFSMVMYDTHDEDWKTYHEFFAGFPKGKGYIWARKIGSFTGNYWYHYGSKARQGRMSYARMLPERIPDFPKRFDHHSGLRGEFDARGEANLSNGSSHVPRPWPDCDHQAYEHYLRNKWRCSDAMPDSFDPKKLELKRTTLFSTRNKEKASSITITKGRETPKAEPHISEEARPSADPQAPLGFPFPASRAGLAESVLSVGESLESGEQVLDGYESDATTSDALTERSTHTRRRANALSFSGPTTEEPLERKPTPRIRAGSKPPLSRSAYANCGVSCADANCSVKERRALQGVRAQPRSLKDANAGLVAMKYAFVCLTVGLLRLSRLTLAQDPNDPDQGVTWIYPPRSEKSLRFHYLDTIIVSWTSYFADQPLLYTFCRSENGSVATMTRDQVEPFNGSMLVDLDWTDNVSPCWFNLRSNTSTGYGSKSVKWSYELDPRSPVILESDLFSTTASESPSATPSSTTGLVTTSPATVSATVSATVPVTVPTPAGTDAASTPPAANTGLSTGVQAGVGIGIGLGGLGFGAVAAFWFMRRRKKAADVSGLDSMTASAPHYHGYDHHQGGPGHGPFPASYHDLEKAPLEMACTPVPQEMAGTSIPQELGPGTPSGQIGSDV
ncbi:hypothetical protein DL771_007376 [Monosporascus sp. 5C6A]|nr:hypothetical protein DL771_007376 [Monosporascus sp. 5C6A]